jgi:hypothetical protein
MGNRLEKVCPDEKIATNFGRNALTLMSHHTAGPADAICCCLSRSMSTALIETNSNTTEYLPNSAKLSNCKLVHRGWLDEMQALKGKLTWPWIAILIPSPEP